LNSLPSTVCPAALADHDTPMLVLDERVMLDNVAAMAAIARRAAVGLRPHAKAHKSLEIARAQLTAGAVGITVATLREAHAMASGGIESLLIANQVVGRAAVDRLSTLCVRTPVMVLVDSADNVREISAAALRAGSQVPLVVEVDVGRGRAGARSVTEAVTLVELAGALDGVTLAGIHGYEGHCSDEADRTARAKATSTALDRLYEVSSRLLDLGIGCPLVSAGSTGTCHEAAQHPAVTEIQPGSYVFMDRFHDRLVDDFAHSLAVATTVLTRHGDLVVLDAGRKALGADLGPPILPPGLEPVFLHEEHLGARDATGTVAEGDRMLVVPGYAPSAVNLFGHYTVLTVDGEVDRWEVRARHGI
jgi:D-serine deaminase-like pyridoxal phosphate-dependent protein